MSGSGPPPAHDALLGDLFPPRRTGRGDAPLEPDARQRVVRARKAHALPPDVRATWQPSYGTEEWVRSRFSGRRRDAVARFVVQLDLCFLQRLGRFDDLGTLARVSAEWAAMRRHLDRLLDRKRRDRDVQ